MQEWSDIWRERNHVLVYLAQQLAKDHLHKMRMSTFGRQAFCTHTSEAGCATFFCLDRSSRLLNLILKFETTINIQQLHELRIARAFVADSTSGYHLRVQYALGTDISKRTAFDIFLIVCLTLVPPMKCTHRNLRWIKQGCWIRT